MSRRRLPHGCHLDGDPYDATLDWRGIELRRYGRSWCAQTLEPGVWRSVTLLAIKPHTDALLDALHAERYGAMATVTPINGQLDIFETT
ncbi:MAG: hypothetical protein WBM50_18230 [Acidimicrobiales bacterium]